LRHKARGVLTLAALTSAIALSFTSLGMLAGSSNAEASTIPTCASGVLSLRLGFSQGAGGSEGTPIVITNNGSAACSITGYPIVVAHTEAASPHPITYIHRPRSQIYVAAPVKIIVLAPKGTASFGISYLDGLDQQDGQGRDCLMSSVTVQIPHAAPVRKIRVPFTKGTDGFGGPINSCFAGFEFGLTPIVRGSTPPEH